ncbi:MAG: ABC transporter substrate-binding protein [Aestuariivita sp.]|nr:ABC transporter substrate-binding protein [Aestuariivita sp.]
MTKVIFKFLFSTICVGFAIQTSAKESRVAIANFGPHPALEQVIKGFKTGLADSGFKEGETLEYEYLDASFDPSIVAQMLTTLEATNPDLLMTVTTPVTQAAMRAIRNPNIPIVFAPVTDPVDAGLVPSWNGGSERFTGASNLQSMETVFEFAQDLLGEVKSVGLLYNPGDANDVVNVSYAEAAAKKMDIELVALSVESQADISVRVDGLAETDVLYVIPSSMLQPALPAIATVARRIDLPVINASPLGVADGQILASMSVSWFDVGREAGLRAARVLNGEPISSIDIFRPSPEDHSPFISSIRLKETGMTLSDALADCQCLR